MSTPADKQPDKTRIVAFLAEESQRSVAEVAQLYEHERSELALVAHVVKFLDIFATRNVQEILRKRAADRLGELVAGRPILAV